LLSKKGGNFMPTNYADELKKYLGAATEEYTPIYNSKVTALKNALSSNLLALEQQKGGINTNYDTQVTGQNRQNVSAQNDFSNQVGSRGLGRSSIAVSGLGEMSMTNNRLVGEINTARTAALGNIDAQKTQTQTSFNSDVLNLEADKQSNINSLARNLGDKYDAREYRDSQFAYSKNRDKVADTRYADELKYARERDKIADARYGASRSGGGGGGGRSYSGGGGGGGSDYYSAENADIAKTYAKQEVKKQVWNSYYTSVNQGNDLSYLRDRRIDVIRTIGEAEYNRMVKNSNSIAAKKRAANEKYTADKRAYDKARQKAVILRNRQRAYD
jgi:hypothetical protein